MQYLVIAYDNDNALEKRMQVRDLHVSGVKKLMQENKIIQAGALMENDKMVGSSVFVEFESKSELDEWLKNEPYVVHNVWNANKIQILPVKLLK